MTRSISLRWRVLLGAILWTAGLFVVSGVVMDIVMRRHPHTPRIMHTLFAHAFLSSTLALLCMWFGIVQVRKGLLPIHRLRQRLSTVRDGRDRRVDGAYPEEVQPLVDDLNALLAHQERAVARAQSKAGDLAHGLKTPLAVLAQEAERLRDAGEPERAASIRHQIERMQRQIDYHLAQARAAASGATPGARCIVAESADGLARTLRQLYCDRGISIVVNTPPVHIVRAQREDLDEMLGNLLDNACKWARSRVAIDSARADGVVVITIDDDGAGLDPSMREAVLQRGVRADEAAPGSGFGLAIVRDLAELYGGSITLSGSDAGGLRARLELPAA
jgi:signal transduction histidine kinase